MLKVNKEKCFGCGLCATDCPEAMELGEDGKANILDESKLKECGGKEICPYKAIEDKE